MSSNQTLLVYKFHHKLCSFVLFSAYSKSDGPAQGHSMDIMKIAGENYGTMCGEGCQCARCAETVPSLLQHCGVIQVQS